MLVTTLTIPSLDSPASTKSRMKGKAMNWNTLDLNLLVIFDAIMQEKNLTRTGRRLGMSQPTVSHALARLRYALKDELFVRTPDGMIPTPRAERIAAPVRAALQELQVTLDDDAFVPEESSREFTIAVSNYAACVIVPALVHRVKELAPSVVMNVRPIGRLNMLDELDSGPVEMVLGSLMEGGDRFKCAGLFQDEYVAVLASDHPAVAGELSIESFAGLPHVSVTSSGDDAHFVDDALSENGLARQVAAKVPLHSLRAVLSGSQAVAVVPQRVAADFATDAPVTIRALPFPSPRITVSAIWHRRLDAHPAHRWLRDTLRSLIPRAQRHSQGG